VRPSADSELSVLPITLGKWKKKKKKQGDQENFTSCDHPLENLFHSVLGDQLRRMNSMNKFFWLQKREWRHLFYDDRPLLTDTVCSLDGLCLPRLVPHLIQEEHAIRGGQIDPIRYKCDQSDEKPKNNKKKL
jgi:hypothetical protein